MFEGSTENEIETAFASALQGGAGAVFIGTDLFLTKSVPADSRTGAAP